MPALTSAREKAMETEIKAQVEAEYEAVFLKARDKIVELKAKNESQEAIHRKERNNLRRKVKQYESSYTLLRNGMKV